MKTIKRIVTVILATILTTSTIAVAYPMDMYINEQYVKRDIVSLGGFDMLPIADIAGELGYEYVTIHHQGVFKQFYLIGYYNDYYFTMGEASVYDYWDKWIGLDIVPMEINGKVRIPNSFITRELGLSYTWDSASNTIFINSPNAYSNINRPKFIAHKTSHKFHSLSCKHLPAEYNRIYYKSRQDAINDGMIPCKVCKP